VEIVAADLNGLVLVMSGDGYSYHSEALGGVDVRNRSNQEVDYVGVSVIIGSCRQLGTGGSSVRPRRLALTPGGMVHIEIPFGSGGGIISGSLPTEVFVWVSQVDSKDCIYRPALSFTCGSSQ
jgi:hypothetical protein